MPRLRNTDSDTAVSLFPFLDALSGVIGILALIICTIAALNMKNAKQIIEHASNYNTEAPIYVECQSDSLVIHPEKEAVLVTDAQEKLTAWHSTLDDLCESDGQHLVFLVRPDGFETFHFAYEEARQMGINIGYDAVYSDGEIVIEKAQIREE